MHPLFQDLLFPCVTGSLDLSSKPVLKIFVCSNIRQTCTWINQKVDELTKEAFLNIYPGLGEVSIRFICKWILGKPAINKLEEYPLQDFSLELMMEKISSLTPLYCACTYKHANLLITKNPEFSFIDLKNWPQTAQPYPVFTDTVQPIFYNDKLMMIYKTENEHELRCYTIGPELTISEQFRKPIAPIKSMQRLDDYVVFQSEYEVIAISLDDYTAHKPEGLQGAKFVKSLVGELLFYKKEMRTFYRLYVENMQLKVSKCPVAANSTAFGFYNWHHVFHKQSEATIFYFDASFSYCRLGAISSNTPAIIFTDSLQTASGKLIAFKDKVLFCSLDQEEHLKIESIDLKNGIIEMTPIAIKGGEDHFFVTITSVVNQLDKLFIIACSNESHSPVYHHLVIIDMTTQNVESITVIGTSFGQETRLIIPAPGKVHVTFPKYDTLEIFNVDYT